jgi:nitrite reductase (cytochrome c-552)
MTHNSKQTRGIGAVPLLVGVAVIVAAAVIAVLLLLENIATRKREALQYSFQIVQVDENTIDPAEWGKNFPRQYDSYQRTVDMERTRHGGSDAFQKLDEFPRWRTIFDGYPFAVDYREERGHAYMLIDQIETERVTLFNQPGACIHCHASTVPYYRQVGIEAGVKDTGPHDFNWPAVMKGFEEVCGKPLTEVHEHVHHPVSCLDCHDTQSMKLRITRPAFINGIQVLAKSDDPLPHLPSIERWRKGDRNEPYDPNALATRHEMRTMVCAQCHVEYYFKGEDKIVTYPWHKGLKVEQMEAYYDEVGWKDWTHAQSGAPVLKAQHPEFELWSQGIHARAGVSCADCHMPYVREGAVKVSSHHVRSPLLNIAASCQTCHRVSEEELLARAEKIQDRTKDMMDRAEIAVVELIEAIASAMKAGATDEQLAEARQLQRRAQWRLDFIGAENSLGFHADQETARILLEAIDYARQGQIALLVARHAAAR